MTKPPKQPETNETDQSPKLIEPITDTYFGWPGHDTDDFTPATGDGIFGEGDGF